MPPVFAVPPDREAAFVLDSFRAAYLGPEVSATLGERASAAASLISECRLCPRRCGADRLRGETGVCKTLSRSRIASAFPHPGEERCLSGTNGSGTIFFNQCNLHCVFCQNTEISFGNDGDLCGPAEMAGVMISLQRLGCHNINLVTPTHVVPQIIEALREAVPMGLSIPLVYNCGGYESLETLRILDGMVDIYMPDFKFWTTETASLCTGAKDYPERAREAILEMHRQVGPLKLGRDGLARRGVLLRHLVMPNLGHESAAILGWVADKVSPDTYVNIMGQYRPGSLGKDPHTGKINRPLDPAELQEAFDAAIRAGLWRFAN